MGLEGKDGASAPEMTLDEQTQTQAQAQTQAQQVEAQKRSSLADTLMQDFSELPKKAKTDLDEYAVINVGPSVVPNPYLPSFRVFAYNITEAGSVNAMKEKDKKKKKKKKKDSKRNHGHRHSGKESEVDCSKKENKAKWACRPKKPQHAREDSPSRTNMLWTPLGYAQVSASCRSFFSFFFFIFSFIHSFFNI